MRRSKPQLMRQKRKYQTQCYTIILPSPALIQLSSLISTTLASVFLVSSCPFLPSYPLSKHFSFRIDHCRRDFDPILIGFEFNPLFFSRENVRNLIRFNWEFEQYYRVEDLYLDGFERCYLLDFVVPKDFACRKTACEYGSVICYFTTILVQKFKSFGV